MKTRSSGTRRPGRPPTGKAIPAAERMRRLRARRKAEGLRAVTLWQPQDATACGGIWSSHRIKDARSLAMHVVVARRIEKDRTLLRKARSTLERWASARGQPTPQWIDDWRRLFARPWRVVLERITALDEGAARLRQSSPLVVLLSEADRRRVHEAFRA